MHFNFTESTISGVRYLYHKIYSPPPPPPFSNELIRNNALHIVPYSIQIPDGSEVACYDLGGVHDGLISLVHVFHPKRPIKMEELILLMHGIVSTIIAGVKAGLDENSFVLEPRYIYMKRNSTQPRLVYLPTQVETPLRVGFASLVQYLATAHDDTNPLTNQILIALKNIARGDFNYRDVAAVVVTAANERKVEEKYLAPQKQVRPPKQPAPTAAPTPQEVKQAGFIRRLISSLSGSKEPANYEDPFADFDEKTMISQTDTSTIGLNVAVLCEMDGGMRICQIPITKDSFVLGRKRNEADYCFEGNTAADKGISRIHASIVFDGSDYYLTDKGSSGGTFLNENRLAPGQSAKIVHGDRIRLYQKELIFEHA